jgi:hypothetical protein
VTLFYIYIEINNLPVTKPYVRYRKYIDGTNILVAKPSVAIMDPRIATFRHP